MICTGDMVGVTVKGQNTQCFNHHLEAKGCSCFIRATAFVASLDLLSHFLIFVILEYILTVIIKFVSMCEKCKTAQYGSAARANCCKHLKDGHSGTKSKKWKGTILDNWRLKQPPNKYMNSSQRANKPAIMTVNAQSPSNYQPLSFLLHHCPPTIRTEAVPSSTHQHTSKTTASPPIRSQSMISNFL